MDNKALVRKWFDEVWNKGRTEAIGEMLAPRGVVHGVGPDMVGPAGFKSFHSAYRDAFPDVRVEVHDMVAEGDKVAFRWTATATHKGGGLGFAATGKRVVFEGMGLVRVENGMLVEGWNLFDELGMLKQLGRVNPTAGLPPS